MPKQRKLSADEEEEAMRLLDLKCNKKMLKDKLSQESGKVVLLKDLSNLSTKAKSSKTRNDLQSTVRELTEKYGKTSTIIQMHTAHILLYSLHTPNARY